MKETLVEKVTADELLEEIDIILKDELIANLQKNGQNIDITLNNGQKFALTVVALN